MPYTPLQIISSYSLLHSTISISELIHAAKDYGYKILGLTDVNVMYGAIEFYNECLKNGIHPVIGLTLKVTGLIRKEREFKIILLAQNNTGYQNLLKISTAKMTKDPDQLLSWLEVKENLSGIHIITPLDGELRTLLTSEDSNLPFSYLNLLKSFASSGVDIGISPQDDESQVVNLKKLSKETSIPLVALDPVRYLAPEDYFSCQVMEAIENSSKIVSPIKESHQVGRQWLKPIDKITTEFSRRGLADAVRRSNELGALCKVEIEKRPTQLPHFDNSEGVSSKQFLLDLCQKGLKIRKERGQIDKHKLTDYQSRLNKELKVIDDMGFNDYFLIVWDVINYAHQVNVMTGPGRGSAAGSLVSYTLFITDVDPIQYDLLFERFLNKERAQMPDIDLDIPDNKRDVILKYVHDKYGDDRVAQIITFGTFGAKQSLRDVGRVFGMTPKEVNAVSKTIPSDLHITLNEAYQRSQQLRNVIDDQPLNELIFKIALKLEGLPRQFGTHAAGLILSAVPLIEMAPLQTGNDNMKMTQYSKNYTEEVGLLKIDFLGLRNLSTLANIIDLVHQHGHPDFNIDKINLNDTETLHLFQTGDTNGVFQFESNGIKRVLKSLHPDNFDLVAAVDALYRPGPMQNIDTFIKRKKGEEPVNYPSPELKSILAPTFGIIVYQEQVMQVASVMGGFTLGQADILRRAMSKKKHQVMDSMRTQFMNGAQKKGFSKQVANQTFDYIDQFASYGFNKSHAVAYSKMAFELAYLKAHFAPEFFTAILNGVLGNDHKLRIYVQEIKKRHLNLSGPNVNESDADFNIVDQMIMFGLADIHGLRSDLIQDLIEQRKKNGPFKGINNFIQRIDPKFRKDKLIKPLIDSGGMDCFGYHRSELSASLHEFIESINLSGNSIELIQVLRPKVIRMPEWSIPELLEKEKATLGVYLSKYPVEQYDDVRRFYRSVDTSNLSVQQGQLTILLYINGIKKIRTKRGQLMAFVNASDENGEADVVIFPTVYNRVGNWLHSKMVVMIMGKLEKNRGLQIVANQILPAANVQSRLKKQKHKRCYLRLDKAHDGLKTKRDLFKVIGNHRGNISVLLYQVGDDSKRLLGNEYMINDDSATIKVLNQLLGSGNVVFKEMS